MKGGERKYSKRRGRARGTGRGDWAKEELEVAGKDGRDVHVGCRGSISGNSTRDLSWSQVCGSLRLEQGGRCVVSYLEDITYAQFLRD